MTKLHYEYLGLDDLEPDDKVSAQRIEKLLEKGSIILSDLWSRAWTEKALSNSSNHPFTYIFFFLFLQDLMMMSGMLILFFLEI